MDHGKYTVESLSAGLKDFLDSSKTERETVSTVKRILDENGYKDISEINRIRPGDKVYRVRMNKAVMIFHVGSEPLENGMNIAAAHIDSPHIDLKPVPVYEDHGLVYFDTHYYGSPKQYQWKVMPLALHGVVAKKDGTVQNIVIGEDPNDPVIVISDLLPHLEDTPADKAAPAKQNGEILDVLIGGAFHPEKKDGEEENLKALIRLLKAEYDIDNEDFMSAELQIVPAGKARDCGLDKSMIMAFGIDDRVCVYPIVTALLETDDPARTACCMLVDKEEVGSIGATGMQSRFFENTVAELVNKMGLYSDLMVRRTLENSRLLSMDVTSAYDPMFPAVFDARSAGYFGKGIAIKKYCGISGKYMSNDSNAEFIAYLRRIFDERGITYQMPEMGKVDVGGGGTLTHYFAQYGMEAIDAGVAIMCMHAPWELTSKTDVYETYRAVSAFLNDRNL